MCTEREEARIFACGHSHVHDDNNIIQQRVSTHTQQQQ